MQRLVTIALVFGLEVPGTVYLIQADLFWADRARALLASLGGNEAYSLCKH